MKTTIRSFLIALFYIILVSGFTASCQQYDENNIFYGIEIKDMLCGYSELSFEDTNYDGIPCTLLTNKVHVLLSLMRSGVDMDIVAQYYIDTVNNQVREIEITRKIGETVLKITTIINEDSIHYTSSSLSLTKSIKNEEDIIIDQPLENPELYEDFVKKGTETKTYRFFDLLKGEIIEKTYTMTGFDTVTVSGLEFHILLLNEVNSQTGEKAEFWMDINTGHVIKLIFPSRTIYLADRSVIKKISAAKMDDVLFYKVDEVISNASDVTYMKIRAKIESAGEVLSVESLNIPGQKFTGTVVDNIIDGIFEIAYKDYDGTNSPPFPPDFSGNEDLKEYLEPSELIESNNEMLVRRAKEITGGSTSSWEAAVKLCMFVSEYIDYAIPGGTSALKTYEGRLGECGGHSRLLTALCRGVGIPARLAIGCIYSYVDGGIFGQHAWTEIYMGEAGWIPVDATAGEFDHVNSTHLRLGENTSFHPEEMEILEYKISDEVTDTTVSEIEEKYFDCLGNYKNPKTGNIVTIKVKNGFLAAKLPNNMTLELNEPDEEGFWYAKLSASVNFSFYKDDEGKVDRMWIQEIVPVAKKEDDEPTSRKVPEEYAHHVGVYKHDIAGVTFEIIYNDGLVVYNPQENETLSLHTTKTKDKYIDANDKNAYVFERNDSGDITHMRVYYTVELYKLPEENDE